MEQLEISTFFISQVLVALAFIFAIGASQFSDAWLIRGSLGTATGMLAVHFLLLEVHTAAFAAAIASLRFFISIFWSDNWLLYLFIGLVFVSAVYSYNGSLTILAAVGSTFATFAAFQSSERNLRCFLMCSSIVMLVHNLFAQSPAAVAFEFFFLLSNMLAYHRHVLDTR
jgi:hypothetical protein